MDNYFVKRMPYCLGSGLELLSAFLAAKVMPGFKSVLYEKSLCQ